MRNLSSTARKQHTLFPFYHGVPPPHQYFPSQCRQISLFVGRPSCFHIARQGGAAAIACPSPMTGSDGKPANNSCGLVWGRSLATISPQAVEQDSTRSLREWNNENQKCYELWEHLLSLVRPFLFSRVSRNCGGPVLSVAVGVDSNWVKLSHLIWDFLTSFGLSFREVRFGQPTTGKSVGQSCL